MRIGRLIFAIALVLLFATQWWIPWQMADRQREIVDEGQRLLLPVRGADPVDPFRGRYIAIRPVIRDLPNPAGIEVHEIEETKVDRAGEPHRTTRRVYREGPDDPEPVERAEGFLLFEITPEDRPAWIRVSFDRPPDERLYFPGVFRLVPSPEGEEGGDALGFDLPPVRYYLNEDVAPQAEAILREAFWRQVETEDGMVRREHRDQPDPAVFLELRVQPGGRYAVNGLLIGGKPIEELARQRRDQSAMDSSGH